MASYFEQQKNKQMVHLRKLIKDLPPFTEQFFRGMSETTAIKTRLAYAYDLRIFFNYLLDFKDGFEEKTMKDIKVEDLDSIDSEDIDRFLEYITYYTKPNPENADIEMEFQNDENGKSRKLAAIRSMCKFFYKRKKIKANPAEIVEIPKKHDKAIIYLDVDEMADLLDEIENGENLTERQKKFHEKLRVRDLALVSLMLGTGMRVSECVGIDIDDIDFKQNGVKVTRKGGNQVILYFSDEVKEALLPYIEQREKAKVKKGHEKALFLSNRGMRITVRAVENLVKKYSQIVTKVKRITPHKLRSTYGTNLYRETGDIYLVADVLGHADVNTTRKHYAAIEDSRRRSAATKVKLRRD
ncbi:MAG TPA: tyrosine-type recombinase/integrase [Candidatus Fimicola cottocaccae]|nr:tyrosine-type recombinase/integrase [Candidatus Fimicola cottocaccae]